MSQFSPTFPVLLPSETMLTGEKTSLWAQIIVALCSFMLHHKNMNERFKIKGINDEESFCMCCGKSGLQKVVWIEDAETGSTQHFGTICALKPAKAFGLTKDDLKGHEVVWKTTLAIRHSKARRLYREAGGEMKMVTPYSATAANRELWEECLKKAA